MLRFLLASFVKWTYTISFLFVDKGRRHKIKVSTDIMSCRVYNYHMNNLKKTQSKNLKAWTRKVYLLVIPFILIDDCLWLQQQEKLGGEWCLQFWIYIAWITCWAYCNWKRRNISSKWHGILDFSFLLLIMVFCSSTKWLRNSM